MEPPDIWVVVPLSRPGQARHVAGCFEMQTYQRKRLCVVENGSAVGAFKRLGLRADLVLSSEPHHSVAKNTGIRAVSDAFPDAYYVGMDDDDYYSKHYLDEHAALAQRGQVAGKWNGLVAFDSGLVYFPRGAEPTRFIGGTIGCFASEAPEFFETVAEEGEFCAGFERSQLLSHRHFVYNRCGDPMNHAWKASEKKMWRRLGGKGVRLSGHWSDWIDADVPAGPLSTWRAAA